MHNMTAALAIAIVVVGARPLRSEDSIEIHLNAEAANDPLLQFVLPGKKGPRQLVFGGDHIRMVQKASSKSTESGVFGLKLNADVRGDFSFELDLVCQKLEPPKEGWGHGLLIRFLTADADVPKITFGCVATPNFDRAYRITMEQTNSDSPVRHTVPCEFTSGTWRIQRKGENFLLSVREGGEFEEIKQLECTSEDLTEIQIWSTRLAKESVQSDFRLKRLTLRGTEFFSQGEKQPVRWTRWGPFWVSLTLCACMLTFYALRSRKS